MITEAERVRRARVVRGWAFTKMPDLERIEIIAYLHGDTDIAPAGYERNDKEIPLPVRKNGRWNIV